MAFEEVSFINMLGNTISISNLVNQMVDYYNQKLEIGETRITDFNEGSEIRNLLEAFAVLCFGFMEEVNEATKISFISTSYGEWLDKIGELPFINLERIKGEYSVGIVTFTLKNYLSFDFVVPAKTVLVTSDGLEFETDSDCIITSGELTNNVYVTCVTTGEDGNIGANKLTEIKSDDIDTSLISVTNADSFTGGADLEDDEVYRKRLLDNVQSDGFGTLGYYNKLAESITGVHDVLFVSDNNYTRKILVNGFTKPTPDSVLLNVLAEFSDTDKKVLNHSFTVDKPLYSNLDLTFNFNVKTELDEDILKDIITAVVNGGSVERIEFEGLNIGENLTSKLFKDYFEFFDDIVSCTINVTGGNEFVSTDIGSNYVVKLGTVTVNQTVV